MTTDNFAAIKAEILSRAKEARACREEYGRAYEAETLPALMDVVKDNFHWACRNKVITVDLIERYKSEFADNDIYCNQDVRHGFLLCVDSTVTACDSSTVEAYGSSTVEAYDSSTVEAYDSSTVEAYGNSTVTAYGNSTVEAYDSSTVKAYGNSYCTSYGLIECKLSDNAIYRVQSTNEIFHASDEIKFVKR